jgi:amino acid adenylation domain-containing protein
VLGHELPLRDFFGGATIAGNAERLTTSVVDPSASPHPKPLQRDESIPLSFSQERMWFIQQLNPGTSAYNISGAVWLDGTFDKSAMERAWTCIVARHESLRTNIVTTDGIPYQVIAESDSFRFEWADVSELPEAERRTEARQLAISRASRPFDLERECPLRVLLVRVAENRQLMAVVIHHAMGDLWSLGVMGRELVVHYNAFRAGRTPELPSLPIQYRDFAIWQRNWFTGQRLEGEKAYWRKQLDGIQPLSLPTDRPRNAALSLRGGRVMSELPAGLAEASSSLAVRVGITPFMLLLGVFNVLLSRYAQMTDISVGVPIANRTHVDIESLVGTFVNTLVLRNDLSGDPTFTELLERVREVALGAYAHQDLPFEKLVTELSPERDMSSAPLVQVLFNVVNIPMQVPELDGLMLIPEPLSNQGAQFDLTLSVSIREPRGVSLSYNQELFDPATAEQIMTHYVALLEDAIRRPDVRLSDLEMMSAAERSKLLESWNQTAMEYPRNVIFAELFEAQVARDPERTAVESGNESLTYGELDSRAEAVAGALRARAVGVGARVAVLMDRGPDMIVSLLGIMKSGAAYVPLDPAFPARRLGFVLEDSGAAVMLTQVEYAAMLTGSTAEILCVGALAEQVCETEVDTGTTAAAAGPEDPAYVIYTSGSTGKPKGVVVPNRALVNFLYAMVEQPGLSESDVLAAVTTVSFDIAALELYLPLLVGARVALLRKEEVEDPFQLAESLERAGATAMQATPATWRMLIDSGWQGIPDLKALCGGEALPPDLVASLLLRVRELWNMYGPTETTIWSSIHKVESVEDLISIGRPIANTQIHILDEQLQPVPVGARGELHIGGDGLARGYLNRPELTKEKFIPNPLTFALSPRLYKTGDVARYLPDGRIECLGRMDHQVKIRGFRIELGEIETALSGHPAVNKCVVVAREDSPGAKRLAAYYLPSDGQSLTVSDMRSHLKQTLPDYMIPTVVVCLDKLPLTPNGKIDRRALPILKQSWADSERQFAAPRTPVEETLAEIWREVLGLEKVGIHDDFFDLGGHSLLATQVVSRLRRSAFPVELPLRQLFDSPTIAALGEFVAQSLVDQQQGEELSQIISEIQDLTPEELEARLNEIGMNV